MKKHFTAINSRVKKILIFIVCLIVIVLISFFVIINISPTLGSWIIRLLFKHPPLAPPPDRNYSDKVLSINDIPYGDSKHEFFDLYLPEHNPGDESYPLILWVHGGAFVGGDKKDALYFAQALAYQGYAVAVINYSLAPESKYPVPVFQTGKAFSFLIDGSYSGKEHIDNNRIFIAGDSAGAHIAAQFTALKTNPQYRDVFKSLHGSIPFTDVSIDKGLSGALLYCGPYVAQKMYAASHPLLFFMVWQGGWAYFGNRNLLNTPIANEIDIIQNVTGDFPPTFITDGNTLSFTEHAKDLYLQLSTLDVSVTELFFDDTDENVYHEFQFNLKSVAGREALNQTLLFLEQYRCN